MGVSKKQIHRLGSFPVAMDLSGREFYRLRYALAPAFLIGFALSALGFLLEAFSGVAFFVLAFLADSKLVVFELAGFAAFLGALFMPALLVLFALLVVFAATLFLAAGLLAFLALEAVDFPLAAFFVFTALVLLALEAVVFFALLDLLLLPAAFLVVVAFFAVAFLAFGALALSASSKSWVTLPKVAMVF